MDNRVDNVLAKIIDAFNGIDGIDAIVLGGSRATDSANDHSDTDIGIYYNDALFDLQSFKQRAVEIDDLHREDVITNPGDWGPWINGGGWLQIDGMAVDILFRNTREVVSVVNDCMDGKISIDYQSGHPYGFVNAIYMGEVATCKILCGSNSLIQDQKDRLIDYPENYRKAAIRKFLWECAFSEQCGRKAIGREDILYAAGSLFRCAVSLLHVLYAINRMYMLNEKGSLQRLTSQEAIYLPGAFSTDIKAALSELNNDTIQAGFDRIQKQYNELLEYDSTETNRTSTEQQSEVAVQWV